MQKCIKTICLLIVCISLALSHDASAQLKRYKHKRQYKNQNNRTARFTGKKLKYANEKKYLTLGVSTNALNYFGDVVPKTSMTSTDISFTRPGLGISSSVRLGSSMAVRAGFLYGRITSSDFGVADPNDALAVYRYARNLHFRNNIKDFSLVGVWDLLSNPGTVMFRMNFTPYVFAGISVFHHNPKALVPERAILHPYDTITPSEAGQWVSLRPLHTEGKNNAYSAFQLSIPVGIGFRYRINQLMDFEAEMSYRHLFTDYLDDVSHNYVDKGTLDSDLAKIMSDRSLEPTDALTGEERLQKLKNSDLINTQTVTYVGADGKPYIIMTGYGQANQIRGSSKDNDVFITTTFRLVFIIGGNPFTKR